MTVELSRIGDYALITLRRPETLNALSFDIIRQLGEAFDAVTASDARALIITGAGNKAFCAGADIKELMDRSPVAQKRGAELGQRTFAKLDSLSVPSIALINGYCFGGGLEMALACTFRLVTPEAKMGLPEVKLGLIPGYGGTQRLPRLIGQSRALEMILAAETIGAEEAVNIGLANRLVESEEALDAAQAFAGRFARFSLPVVSCAREAVQRAQDIPLDEGLRVEANLSTLAYQTEDATEGMAAFSEKRTAQFKDR